MARGDTARPVALRAVTDVSAVTHLMSGRPDRAGHDPVPTLPSMAGRAMSHRTDTGSPEDTRPVRVGRRSEQIVGRERDRIAARLRRRYLAGATIRELATETGRSFGWVRTLLTEAGVVLRTRGGDRRASRHQGVRR